jgi:uncharacterized protein (DUF433 family)
MHAPISTHIELRPNRDGHDRAYVAGTRVRVQDVYALSEIHGLGAEAIAEQLPPLTLGQIHAALSYYFDHRDQIVAEIRQDEEFAHLHRARTGPGPLEQFLKNGGDAVSP